MYVAEEFMSGCMLIRTIFVFKSPELVKTGHVTTNLPDAGALYIYIPQVSLIKVEIIPDS